MGLFRLNIEKLKARKNVEGLIKALGDWDWDVRKSAAYALGEIGGKRLKGSSQRSEMSAKMFGLDCVRLKMPRRNLLR